MDDAGAATRSSDCVRLLSWNVNQRDLWDAVGASGADVALLQEVPVPAEDVGVKILPGVGEQWATGGWEQRPWRTAIAQISDAVRVEPVASGEMTGPDWTSLRVSRSGTLTVADVIVDDRVIFTVASVYAPWERPPGREQPIWADGSAHRLLSDLAPLLWDQNKPLIVSGDWNILYGYGEHGDEHFKRRYQGVFDRAAALGLSFVGPKMPNGRQANPWPEELPEDSCCVPTFHHSHQTPETATRQLDFVFASASIAERVHARALNEVAEWGPSDHCRLMITVDL